MNVSRISSQFLADVLALFKPRITLLAVITTAVGMKLSGIPQSYSTIFNTLLGSAFLVSGAGALNMFLERDIDDKMERTKQRPLPARRLSPDLGLGLGALMIGIAIPWLMFWANTLTGWVGVFSLFTYVLVYTPLKKRTPWALLIGAIPGAAPPLLGWAAATNSLSLPGWILFGIMFLWQIPHFLAIGIFRREEYAEAGLKIFPLDQDQKTIKTQMLVSTLALIPLSFVLVPLNVAGNLYLAAAVFLNLFFLAVLVWGLFQTNLLAWGKRVFQASLVYLTLLFLFLFLEGFS